MSTTKKEDFIFILSLRGASPQKSKTELWKRQLNDLLRAVGRIQKSERMCISVQQQRRHAYNDWTSSQLLQELRRQGLAARGMTRGGMIDILLEKQQLT
jgi:hypothetical protein